jgi:hypothetical protein
MQRVREGLRTLCSRHRIDLLYAFGSRAGEIAELVCGGLGDLSLLERQ